MKNWYNFKSAGDTTTIDILEGIGFWEITAEGFIKELDAVKTPKIMMRINSPGGDVFDGTAIYNAIKDHPAHVEAHVLGIAASIASIIAMGADEIVMADGAFMMIHNPWVWAVGDAAEIEKTVAVLHKIENSLASIYVDKTGLKLSEVREMMTDETWMDPQEAVDLGFATRVASESDSEALASARAFDFSEYDHTPKDLLTQQGIVFANQKRKAETALRDAGISRAKAKRIVRGGMERLENDGEREREAHDLNSMIQGLKNNNAALSLRIANKRREK